MDFAEALINNNLKHLVPDKVKSVLIEESLKKMETKLNMYEKQLKEFQ